MKYVKEHINEKFSNESDPIHDLGIGGVNPGKKFEDLYKKMFSEYVDYVISLEGKILNGKFRTELNREAKKYNITTEKIKELQGPTKFINKGFKDLYIIFIDENDNKYYYYLDELEKINIVG